MTAHTRHGSPVFPTTTVSRLLRSLESSGFATREQDGRYLVGNHFLRVAATVLGSRPYLRTARPHLEALVEETGESAYLAVPDRPRGLAIYVQHVPSRQAIRHWDGLGQAVPMRGTALRGCAGPAGYAIRRHSVEPEVIAMAAPV